jgi:hypothetical protein
LVPGGDGSGGGGAVDGDFGGDAAAAAAAMAAFGAAPWQVFQPWHLQDGPRRSLFADPASLGIRLGLGSGFDGAAGMYNHAGRYDAGRLALPASLPEWDDLADDGGGGGSGGGGNHSATMHASSLSRPGSAFATLSSSPFPPPLSSPLSSLAHYHSSNSGGGGAGKHMLAVPEHGSAHDTALFCDMFGVGRGLGSGPHGRFGPPFL